MNTGTQDKDLAFRVSQIRELIQTKTARQSGIVFSGNIVSTLLTVIATIFIARTLGPVNYGVLAIYLSIYTTILGLTDFGLGTTAVKLISENLEDNPHRSNVFMKIIIYMEIAAGLIVAIVGLIFSSAIAKSLGGSHLLFPVRMAFLASVFASTGAFIGPFLTAHQKFTKNAIFGASTSAFKTIGVLTLFLIAILNLKNIIIFYTIINIMVLFVGFAIVPKGYMEKSTTSENKKAFKEIFHFSKWILLSYFASVIASRLDIFLLARFKGTEQVGLYAAAQQLAQIMPLVIGTISTVLLPRVSKMKQNKEFVSYVKKVFLGALAIDVAIIPFVIFADFFVHIVFGSKYDGSILLFKILIIGFMCAVLVNPVSLIFYAKNKPKVLTYINYFTLIIAVSLNIIIIPRFGAVGAAICFLLSNVVTVGVVIPVVLAELKNKKVVKSD
jgi:hypothetical protein